MKNISITFFALSIMVLSLLSIPSTVLAQGLEGNQAQPAPINNTETLTTTAAQEDNSWMWLLLPLAIAIPVVYLLTRDRGDDHEVYYDRDTRIAGVKGGRAGRVVHEDEEVI